MVTNLTVLLSLQSVVPLLLVTMMRWMMMRKRLKTWH